MSKINTVLSPHNTLKNKFMLHITLEVKIRNHIKFLVTNHTKKIKLDYNTMVKVYHKLVSL